MVLKTYLSSWISLHWPESPEVYWPVGGDSAPWPAAGGANQSEAGMRGCLKPHFGPHLVKNHHLLHHHLISRQTKGWDDQCSKTTFNHSSTADGNTSVHGGVSILRVIGVWWGVGWRFVANYKVDCSLEDNNSLLHHLISKWKRDCSRFEKLTPIFCPFSLTKGTFLDGNDLTCPEESSRNGIFVDPRNLWCKKDAVNIGPTVKVL